VLNSYALRLLIESGGPLSLRGAAIDIDQLTNEPSGLVFENGDERSSGLIPPVGERELMSSLDEVFREMLANGITSVQDATVNNSLQDWTRFREICGVRKPRPRIGFMVGQAHLSEFVESGLGPGDGDEWLYIGPVKIMLTETEDAFQPTFENLQAQIGQAQRQGFQVAIHAVEESAVCVAIEALSEAATKPGFRSHRIEHCSVIPPGLVGRLAELKIAVVTQPGFLHESGDRYLSEVETHIREWLYPFKSLLENGVIVGAGSDAPVAPAVPLQGIRAAASRLSRDGFVVGSKECLSSDDALRLFTSGAAMASGEFASAGSIEPGKLADVVVLSEDLTTIDPRDIDKISPKMTIVNGQVAWQKAAK
jgi:predicted amidohydrolase YtcJ